MPRKKTARRFTPCNSIVSQNMVDEEAKYVAREVDDLLILSANHVREFTDQNYELATKSWEALMQELAFIPSRNAEAVRAILYRDFFHALECCRSAVRLHSPQGGIKIHADPVAEERHAKFSEWLFQPHRKEE